MSTGTPTLLAVSISSTSAASSYVSGGTDTPPANALLFMDVLTYKAASPAKPNAVTAFGLTWVEEKDNATFGAVYRMTRWRAFSGAAPTTTTLTIGYAASPSACFATVVAITIVDPSGTNGSGALAQATVAATGTGTTASAVLGSAITAGNMVVAFMAGDVNSAFTVGSGFTSLSQQSSGQPARKLIEYKAAASTTADATMASMNWGAIVSEVKQDPGAALPRIIGAGGIIGNPSLIVGGGGSIVG